jgi:hypothetical protein
LIVKIAVNIAVVMQDIDDFHGIIMVTEENGIA